MIWVVLYFIWTINFYFRGMTVVERGREGGRGGGREGKLRVMGEDKKICLVWRFVKRL